METIIGTATAAKVGSTVTCVINGIIVTVQVVRGLTVASGDVLLLNKYGAGWFAVARLYNSAPANTFNPPIPPVNPVTTSGTLTVSAVETRSYRNGSWRTDDTDVRQGQYGGNGNHTGAAFYGSMPRSLAGATVTAARVIMRRASGGVFAAQASTMRLITESTRPGGAPTLTSSTGGPSLAVNTQTDFVIPTSWAQSMVDGTAGGLGFFVAGATPWIIFTGIGTYGPSFTMNIDWTR
jgi:hypothetical protein